MNDVDLERRLRSLASLLDRDDSDDSDLAERVMADVAAAEHPTRRSGARLVLAAAAVVVIAVAAVLIVPASRDATARWLGVGSTRIEVPPPTEASEASESRASTLDLGAPVPAHVARQQTGLGVPSIASLPDPIGIFVVRPPASGQIVVIYPPSSRLPETLVSGVGALLSATPGRLDAGMFVKVAGESTTVEQLRLTTSAGSVVDAIWLEGEPHRYAFEDVDGEVVVDTLRLATNTLLWSDGGVAYRLESRLDRDEAVALAGSVMVE